MAYEDYLLTNFSTNLKGFWKLDETSGTTAEDAHTTNVDGTIAGTVGYDQPGIEGTDAGSMLFDSNAERVTLESAPGSDLRCSSFTVAIWFKRSGNGDTTTGGNDTPDAIEPMLTKGRGESETAGLNCNYFLGINRDGANPVLGCFYEESDGTGHNIVGGTTIDTDWHFGVATYDGSNMRLYLDGVSDATAHADANGPDSASQQLGCIAGALTSGGANAGSFNGYLMMASVWDTALSAANILALYNQGMPPAPEATLVTSTPTNPPESIVIQLTDNAGVGINHDTVTSADVVLKKDGVALVPEDDYAFAYNSATSQITLTPLKSTRFTAATYTILLNEGQ